MLDGKKYLRQLMGLKPAALSCPHCGTKTLSASGRSAFCNFCEQYIEILAAEAQGDKRAEAAFAAVQAPMSAGKWDDALKNADQLLKNNSDPRQLYLLALFYLRLSSIKYHKTDYALRGFMEANADNIRSSLDLTMKWKECFFKAIKIVGDELGKNLQIDAELVFIKFMSEIKLQRLVDSFKTLRALQTLDKKGNLMSYALIVYNVEARTKEEEESLAKMLAKNEVNAFYYLAKHLAKQKRLEEANKILQKLSETTDIFMVQDLLSKVRATQEASKM